MSNSVIGYNIGGIGPNGPTGGTGPNGEPGPIGNTGSIGVTGASGYTIDNITISDFNDTGTYVARTTFTNGDVVFKDLGISTTIDCINPSKLGPQGNNVFEVYSETTGPYKPLTFTADCETAINLKTITGTGGFVVTQLEDEILIRYASNGTIPVPTSGKTGQIAYMGGSGGNSAEATPLVRGATGFEYNAESLTIKAVSRSYNEVGYRFGITEVSGGSITSSTRTIEFNVNPGLHLGSSTIQSDPYSASAGWGNVWVIDANELYEDETGTDPAESSEAPFVKFNDITPLTAEFKDYFGGDNTNRASAFTLIVKGGDFTRREDGATLDGDTFPPNWIFPYNERPVLTNATDIYQFVSYGQNNDNGIIWYGSPLKSNPNVDIFFTTY